MAEAAIWAAAVAITTAGAAIRFSGLNSRSLWLDEVLSSEATAFSSLGELMVWVRSWIDLMPVYPVITWLLRGFGDGEILLRLPSAVAGTLAILALFILARSLYGSTVGLMSAAILAVLPFAVWFSQEARNYAFLMVFTILQMLFAYRARTRNALLDWAGFGVLTVFNLYTHYLALVTTLVAFAYLAVAVVIDRLGGRREIAVRQALRTVGVAAAVTLAYLPWLRELRTFLRSSNTALSRSEGGPSIASFGQLRVLLNELSFWSVLLIALVVGLIVILARLRNRRDPDLLVFMWAVVPVAGLVLVLRGGILFIEDRYFSFLVPAMVIAAAVGIEAAAKFAYRTAERFVRSRPARLRPVLSAAVAGIVLIGVVPALAGPQPQPQQDYRGAVDYVIRHSPPSSMVIAIGENSPWVMLGFGYYLHLRGSSIALVDGGAVDNVAAQRLSELKGTLWAATTFESPSVEASARAAGLEANSIFKNVVLIRDATAQLPVEQAKALLRWDSSQQAGFASSIDVINAVNGTANLGPNRLDQAQWSLGTGVTMSGAALRLKAGGGEVNATVATPGVNQGERYLLRFHFRQDGLQGYQRVYVVAEDPTNHPTGYFPTGAGYACTPAQAWQERYFGFTVPARTVSLVIWLRAGGVGAAEFEDVALQHVE